MNLPGENLYRYLLADLGSTAECCTLNADPNSDPSWISAKTWGETVSHLITFETLPRQLHGKTVTKDAKL